MENENKRLFEWLNPGKCWHEEMVQTDDMPNRFWSPNCIHCGESDRGRYPPDNPEYTSNVGFFALLSGLRAKDEDSRVKLHQYHNFWSADVVRDGKTVGSAEAETVSEALFQAAIKALTSDALEQGGDAK